MSVEDGMSPFCVPTRSAVDSVGRDSAGSDTAFDLVAHNTPSTAASKITVAVIVSIESVCFTFMADLLSLLRV
jgi:hypothetical protein